MAELYPQERLQPSLLDRLTDDNPDRMKSNFPGLADPALTQPAISGCNVMNDGASEMVAKSNDNTVGLESLSSGLKSNRPLASLQEKKVPSNRLVISARILKECVKRDLSWLLNSSSLDTVVDLDDYPLTAKSVLNYGIPDLTGVSVANADLQALQRLIQQVITRYEPRILKKTLSVRVTRNEKMSRNALRFEIDCDVWGQPVPEHLFLNSEIDLETGSIDINK